MRIIRSLHRSSKNNVSRNSKVSVTASVEANPHLLQQPPPTKGAMNNKAAIEFAQRYNSMTADQVRSARSKAINPLGFQSFIDQTEECIRLRLL